MTIRSYDLANAGKVDFHWTYNRLDPRSYFQAHGALEYAIPDRAAPVFNRAFDAYTKMKRQQSLTVLDIGCSYGVNSAILKYGCTMQDLHEHYAAFNTGHASPREVLDSDQALFAEREPQRKLAMVGVDCAQFAAAYGYWAGLLDAAIPEDLETCDPSPMAIETIARCDLVISTGVIGYITEKPFQRILSCQPTDRMPWIASFVLRMFDYQPIANAVAPFGYVTEKLHGRTFRQRRFGDVAEQNHVCAMLEKRGLGTEGMEREGYILAEFFLSRPVRDAEALPIGTIFSA